MEVDTLMLADGAQAVGGKIYVLGGGWNMIWAKELPTEHRLAIAVGLRIKWVEANIRHQFLLTAETLDNEVFQEIARFEFEVGRPPNVTPGSDLPLSLAVDTVLKLDKEHELMMRLRVDDDAIDKSVPFRVVKAAGPPLTG